LTQMEPLKECMSSKKWGTDYTTNEPKAKPICNVIMARYDRGFSGRKDIGTAVLEKLD